MKDGVSPAGKRSRDSLAPDDPVLTATSAKAARLTLPVTESESTDGSSESSVLEANTDSAESDSEPEPGMTLQQPNSNDSWYSYTHFVNIARMIQSRSQSLHNSL
jgi:hypothetical protein